MATARRRVRSGENADIDGPEGAGSARGEPSWRDRVVGRSLAPAADKAVKRGQLLLSAAGKLILESGADDFTVQQVATKAGLSLRAFYQYFEGKDDLLIALSEETNLVLAELLAYHADKYDDPLDRLGSAIYFSVDDRQHTPSAYNAASARFASRTALSSPIALARSRQPIVDFWTATIAAAVDAEGLHPLDAESAAYSVVALTATYTRTMYVGNDISSALPSHGAFIRFCVCGIGASPAPGWESKFELTAKQAEQSRQHSEQVVARFMRTGA